ncbi:MAG TPA: nickel pincer cofactor biosynthesis protein LarB [Candidatus Omnitrophota bacterium]|nr:nickel pincer cofactor biosynthesis protein LarB [Candidatus Omnitrophota bacterium]HNQ51201.1 nickel pincer cofactor biosynthesis protein LarB [Candidatus Omnitrophota bacterium]HQO37595.1 nickel pincer cofactor biosynthesis protein LarB [Candidatus Omnitrophota bacterium]HQQ05517.1 nickel pincer cofactor biosynthesis protein LarB [Candidatus Omnitrophota bacterium]
MDKEKIIGLLKKVRQNRLSVEDAFCALRHLPYEDLRFAKVDHHRALRTGMPEVIFCEGKTTAHITAICRALAAKNNAVLLTRADERVYRAVKRICRTAVYNTPARTITIQKKKIALHGKVSVVCAGTADIPVAEEAAVTAGIFGSRVERLYDVGVAGLHRLLDSFDRIADSSCIIVLAGMDGVLPSVIGGLSSCPVIAVPTSVGYGANFNGVAPLLTMLNSCSPNVSVVNVNNGFGAGFIGALINRQAR